MTHDTVSKEAPDSAGSERTIVHTIDITALDAAGKENYDAASELDISRVRSIAVVGREDGTQDIVHDHVAGGLHVPGGAADADIGEVRLRVTGD